MGVRLRLDLFTNMEAKLTAYDCVVLYTGDKNTHTHQKII